MSEAIKHECGIVLLRLRKPLQYYIDKYGTPLYAINKMYLLMEKQHNRGQDGAGVASIKLDTAPGKQCVFRNRSAESQPIADIFNPIIENFKTVYEKNKDNYKNAEWLKENVDFFGELWLGHLRYATHGSSGVQAAHPRIRQSNWKSRNLVLAGNFNMTNVDELFEKLVEIGQHPREKADTMTVLEKIGHFLDEENKKLHETLKQTYRYEKLAHEIEKKLDLKKVLKRSFRDFDGGYAIAGMLGYGDAFLVRDPAGIRPAYYYADDEIVIATSERPAIKTAFNVEYREIKELQAGNALMIKKDGELEEFNLLEPTKKLSCSFERIYFSRGTDPDIYNERKELGNLLVKDVLEEINYDLENTVFSYIPNTSETAFLGLIKGLENYLISYRQFEATQKKLSAEQEHRLLGLRPRVEKLIIKDAKLRTFITDDDHRDELVTHVYDVTYEVIRKQVDTIVVIDDSIVRGTTLEKSILTMLDRLEPKKIVIVSSAPQIRYPDCYGIDMSKMKEFVAFRALLALLKDRNLEHKLGEVYEKCVQALRLNKGHEKNYVQELYDLFTDQEISQKIAQIITPDYIKAKVAVIYQSVENLHKACPNHLGDWYFTGNYPTSGGNRVVNQAFVNFMEGKLVRAYQ